MITIVMSAAIGSPRQRVWQALTDPRERVAWDTRLLALIGAPDDAPQASRTAWGPSRKGPDLRWRYRLGPVQTVLRERPAVVEPPSRLGASLALGSLRFHQLYSLAEEPGDAARTRLGMKVISRNQVPLLCEIVDRFEVRRLVSAHIDETLRALRKWCEGCR